MSFYEAISSLGKDSTSMFCATLLGSVITPAIYYIGGIQNKELLNNLIPNYSIDLKSSFVAGIPGLAICGMLCIYQNNKERIKAAYNDKNWWNVATPFVISTASFILGTACTSLLTGNKYPEFVLSPAVSVLIKPSAKTFLTLYGACGAANLASRAI